MKWEYWQEDKFIREVTDIQELDIEGNKVSEENKRLRTRAIMQILMKYANYRNIELKPDQFAVMADHISSESVLKYPYLKFYALRTALHEYTNPENNNISTAIIVDMIDKMYRSQIHREFINRWADEEKENKKLLAKESEASKEEKNRKARLDSYNACIEQVKSNKINFDDFYWKNAIEYCTKDLGLKLSPDQIKVYHEQAESVIMQELKKISTDITVKREERKKSEDEQMQIISKTYEKNNPELNERIKTLRRKMVILEQIRSESLLNKKAI
jgi:hypothetical protein